MTTNDIRTLISSDESRTLERKKTTGELKDGMHSACAFLNTEGGWLIFDVTPNSHKIIGQEVTDKTQQEIAQALAGLEPAVDVRPEYIEVPEHPGNWSIHGDFIVVTFPVPMSLKMSPKIWTWINGLKIKLP